MKKTAVCLLALAALAGAETKTLKLALRADPKTLDPLMVTEEAGDTIRYLTQAPLIRLNRKTQQAEPALATAWKTGDQGRTIRFELRQGVKFSTGEAFDSADVAYTFARLLDSEKKVPAGDVLRNAIKVASVETPTPKQVIIRFAAPVADLVGLFDELPMVSRGGNAKAGLGPFTVTSYEPGANLQLARNANYWKRDDKGARLPYLDGIRIEIQQNRDLEFAMFRRGDLDLMNVLDADSYDRLKTADARSAITAGATLDFELMWFNQSKKAPLAAPKRAWFTNTAFRRAVSLATSRDAIVKLAYRGAAAPAFSSFSPMAKTWSNPQVNGAPAQAQPQEALKLLAGAGFTFKDKTLRDAAGNAVEFSLITNAGNKVRARIAQLMEQDLAAIGIKLNLVTLDMPSVIERIMKTGNYEACLLGIVGVDLDPADQTDRWMSSSEMHQWNPSQPKPETPWEAEMDTLIRVITAEADPSKRRKAVFRLQEITAKEQPMIFLAHPHALMAASPTVTGVEPVALRPRLLWNAEKLDLRTQVSEKR